MKKRDWLIILAVLLIAFVLWFAFGSSPAGDPKRPATVNIYVGNSSVPYESVPFGVEREITVDQGNGCVNTVSVTKTDVHMHSSTCENQDCVQQGEISMENIDERILGGYVICLPNQVVIEVVKTEDET